MFTQMRSHLKFLGVTLFALTFLVGGFFVANTALADVSVTAATGGSAISADTVGGNYTTLTGPVLAESAAGQIKSNNGQAVITLTAPTGFEFDTSNHAIVTLTEGNGTANNNINNLAINDTIVTTTPDSSHILFTITSQSSSSKNTLTYSNIRVRPTSGTAGTNGNITLSSTGIIENITLPANAGALAEVAHVYTGTDFASFDGVGHADQNANGYTLSSGITATYTSGAGTVNSPVVLKLTGYAPIVTPWFNSEATTFNYVTIGIKLPTGFTGTTVCQTGFMDTNGNYGMANNCPGIGSTPLATDGAAKGYLDFSFGANKSYVQGGLFKLEVMWNNVSDAPEYFTIDVSGLQLGPVFNDKNKNGTFDSGDLSFNTIQAAIDTASSGDTIKVAAGDYTEQINITKSLTLTGAGKDTTHINTPEPSTMTIYDAFGSKSATPRYSVHRGANIPVVRIASSGVTFQGFDVNLGNKAFWNVKGSFGTNYSRSTGILVDHVETVPGTPDTFTNVNILNNKVDGMLANDFGDSIKALGNAVVTIQGNTVYAYGESGISALGSEDFPSFSPVYHPTVTITSNTIYGGSGSRSNIFLGIGYWVGATGTADDNTIYNAPNDYGYALNSWTTMPVSFTHNTITTDGGGVGGVGAQLYQSSNLIFSNNTIEKQGLVGAIWLNPVITITNNTITNSTDGFLIDGQTSGSVTINNNSITGIADGHHAIIVGGIHDAESGTIYGTWNGPSSTVTVDATNNWWGNAVLTTVQSKVNDIEKVTVTPYYVDSEKTILSDTIPTTVYVDDNYNSSSFGGHIWEYNAFAKIQDAITAVSSSGTINIAAGTYIEQLTINKNLTLIGAGDTTVIQSPNTTLASTFTATINNNVSPMKPIITINGANASISALKVDGNGKGDSVNNTFFVGIGFYNAGGSLDHVTVTGVKETPVSRDYQGDAVRATNANGNPRTLSITNSTISDFQKNGLTLSGSGLTVTVSGNHVTGTGANVLVAQNGIVLGTGVTGSITGNFVKDFLCDDSTCGNDWYSKSQATAIAISGAIGPITVSGNDVSNSDIGIDSNLTSGISTITDNILTGNRYFGILFENGEIAVSGGSVTGGRIGILNQSVSNSGNKTVHNVNISGNSIAGLKNDAALSINATKNWWGTNVKSEIDAKITGNVKTLPYYNEGTMEHLLASDITVTAENFNTNKAADYYGPTVGFALGGTDVANVASVKVELYSGDTKLVENTSTAANKVNTAKQYSSAFRVKVGTYSSSSTWNLGDTSWTASRNTIPTKAKITVTDTNDVTYTAENTSFAASEPSHSTWESLFPILTYTVGANGTLTGSATQLINTYGSDGTEVTAVPTTNYHFVNWNDSSTQNPRTDKNITGDISVTANFAINQYTLTYTASSNGSITGTASQTVNYGTNGTTVTAVPNTGYHFTNWSDGVLTATRTETNVTSINSVTANFAINTYTLTYTAGANGSITGTTSQTVNYGADGTTVTAVANSGYHFVDWSDGGLTASRTDTNIQENKSVTANFAVTPTSTKAITAFSFASLSATGVVNETAHTIAINVPNGTTVTALVPTITFSGTVSPNTGVAQNFFGPVTYTVTAANSETQDYVVTVTVLPNTQIAAAPEVTVSATQNDVVVNSTAATTITIPENVTNATIDVSSLKTDNGTTAVATLPDITMNVTTSLSTTPVKVEIPTGTVVTAPAGWDGTINAPTIKANSTVTATPDSGMTSTVLSVIEVGYGEVKLTFDKAVRILIPSQAGKFVGYSRGGVFTEITGTCAADNQATGDALVAEGDCKKDVGSDLVIWTKHFTTFATYTQTAISHNSGGSYIPAVPAKVTTPDGCAAGNKFSTTTGRNCNAATPAVGKVLGAEKFNFTKFIKNGSKGDEIIELQKFLTTLGYTLTADGKFGPKTKGAVIKFQKANKLVGDGIVGALTRTVLNK